MSFLSSETSVPAAAVLAGTLTLMLGACSASANEYQSLDEFVRAATEAGLECNSLNDTQYRDTLPYYEARCIDPDVDMKLAAGPVAVDQAMDEALEDEWSMCQDGRFDDGDGEHCLLLVGPNWTIRTEQAGAVEELQATMGGEIVDFRFATLGDQPKGSYPGMDALGL